MGKVNVLPEVPYEKLSEPLKQWAYELPWRVHNKLPYGECSGCLSVGIEQHMVLLLLVDKLIISPHGV